VERTQDAWQDAAHEVIRRAGHSKGAARDALIEIMAQRDCAMSVTDIEQALGERPVGRASVYRALDLLHSLHLISRVDVGDGVARYERGHLDHENHHHHMVCDRCGVLIAFDDAELEQAIHKLSDRLGFDATEHEVTLRGACPDCRA
jgi:Fur family ferric uptake transcriptional regulator